MSDVDPIPNIKSPAQNNILVSPENYKLLVDEGLMWAIGSIITATMRGESFEILQFPFKPGKHPDYPCPTKDCPGDERYAAPGRGHLTTCKHPHEMIEVNKAAYDRLVYQMNAGTGAGVIEAAYALCALVDPPKPKRICKNCDTSWIMHDVMGCVKYEEASYDDG